MINWIKRIFCKHVYGVKTIVENYGINLIKSSIYRCKKCNKVRVEHFQIIRRKIKNEYR